MKYMFRMEYDFEDITNLCLKLYNRGTCVFEVTTMHLSLLVTKIFLITTNTLEGHNDNDIWGEKCHRSNLPRNQTLKLRSISLPFQKFCGVNHYFFRARLDAPLTLTASNYLSPIIRLYSVGLRHFLSGIFFHYIRYYEVYRKTRWVPDLRLLEAWGTGYLMCDVCHPYSHTLTHTRTYASTQ